MRLALLLGVLACGCGGPRAGARPAPSGCSPTAVATERAAAAAALGGHPGEARARLQALKDGCWATLDEKARLGLLADLGAAALGAGDAPGCLAYLGEADLEAVERHPEAGRVLLERAPECGAEDCDVIHAPEELACGLARALALSERAAYQGFASPACPLVADAVALPPARAGDPVRCVELTEFVAPPEGGTPDGEDEQAGERACPILVLVDKDGARLRRRELVLSAPSMWLDDLESCCGARRIRAGRDAEGTLVVVGSDGAPSDCREGTGSVLYFTVYRLDEEALTLTEWKALSTTSYE